MDTTANITDIRIGSYEPNPHLDWQPKIVCDAPSLAHHINQPWFRGWVAERLGVPLDDSRSSEKGASAFIPDFLAARHTLTVGGSGYGKSRLFQHMTYEAMKQGYSIVACDPKITTLLEHAANARRAGLPSERLTILSPRLEGGVPGFNPFNAGIPPAQAAADFTSLLDLSGNTGPRMLDLLTNAAILTAAHGLSVFELVRVLVSDEYLYALIQQEPPNHRRLDREGFAQVREFFMGEFFRWTPSERIQAVAPILRRLRELLRNACLRSVLCARTNTIDLPSLWRRQQVLLIHLDFSELGDHAARLLAGLLVTGLFRTALRAPGRLPVELILDEAATAEKFAGRTLVDILTIARSSNLRLSMACQHLAGLGDDLRAALISQCAVQVFFRLGPADAHTVAAAIAPGSPQRLVRVVASAGDNGEGGPSARWRSVLRDSFGRPVRVTETAWERLRWSGDFSPSPLRDIDRLAASVGTRLYVKDPVTSEPVSLRRYLANARASDYWIEGPHPLSVVISFPKPKLSGAEKWGEHDAAQAWERVLMDLPIRHCVLRLAGYSARTVKVVEVKDHGVCDGLKRYLDAVVRSSGQSLRERDEALRWRRQQIDKLSGFAQADPAEDFDDGSIP